MVGLTHSHVHWILGRPDRGDVKLVGIAEPNKDLAMRFLKRWLITLAPFTVPFARRGGLVLLVKGQRAEEEVGEAKAVLARLDAVHEQTVGTPTGRVVILRRAGT